MQKWKRFNGLLLPLLALTALVLSGCLQSRVGLQGQLTNPDGDPVADGEYDMTIGFYGDDEGGSPLFEQNSTVTVENGLFNVDITDFPPHIFSSGMESTNDTLFMEVEVEGETLEPRRRVSGAPFAHALVAGSGVIGPRQDAATVDDGGYAAALTIVNTELPNNNPGYGLHATAPNAGLFVDNVAGDGSFNESDSPEQNPDIILGGDYLADANGNTEPDFEEGAGVIASDNRPDHEWSDIYIRSNDELELFKSYHPGAASELRVYDGPRFDSNIQMRLDSAGNLSAEGTVTGGGADFAERIDVEGDEADYEPGDVLVISSEQDRAVALATEAASTSVIGVYSANPAFLGGAGTPGEQVEREEAALVDPNADGEEAAEARATMTFQDGAIEVAIAGIVPVKVSAENGAIQRGDLLTTSDTPGHAMKATDPASGTILGKAMGQLDNGTGVIDVLIMLQ